MKKCNILNCTTEPVDYKLKQTTGNNPKISKALRFSQLARIRPLSYVTIYNNRPLPPILLNSYMSTPTSLSIELVQPSNCIDIVNYLYSLDNGATFQPLSPAQNTSPVLIQGVFPSTTYPVLLKSVNIFGISVASQPLSIIVPLSPVLLSATSSTNSVSITFSQSNNGVPIQNYNYSLDNGSTYQLLSPAQPASPILISGLSQNTTYNIVLEAINAQNETSLPSNTIIATTLILPIAPLLLSATPTLNSVSISFIQLNNGVSIQNYNYSLDNGTTYQLLSPAQTTSPITLSGLSQDTTYNIVLEAINTEGLTSTPSNALTTTTLAVPIAPVLLSATSLTTTSISITFSQPSNRAIISNYSYFITNRPNNHIPTNIVFSPPQTTSPVIITNLSPNTVYYIILNAISINNISSVGSNRISTTTLIEPVAPVLLTATPSTTSVSITFSQTDNGIPIQNYNYSLDNGTTYQSFSPAQTTSPITIIGLTQRTTYNIVLESVNTENVASSASNTLTTTTLSLSGSVLLNGTNRMTFPSTTVSSVGLGTFEGWFYLTTNFSGILYTGPTTTLSISSSTFFILIYGASQFSFSVPTMSLNTWYHFALVLNGPTHVLFFNGSKHATSAGALSFTANTIGTNVRGYLSNLRITSTNVYNTANTTITVPTSPLTAVSGTYLLLNTTDDVNFLKDSGPNNFTIGNVGSVVASSNNPFSL